MVSAAFLVGSSKINQPLRCTSACFLSSIQSFAPLGRKKTVPQSSASRTSDQFTFTTSGGIHDG
jgi:hypothetical protein